MTDETTTIAQPAPFAIKVEAGKNYFWCACGKSQKQPFCDGSHKGGSFNPVKYEATDTKKVFFCGCKQSANSPLCDGSHKTL
ncbi:MAG: CDGSH iron-sulfur domain-containing protein [Albidovulum sp.]